MANQTPGWRQLRLGIFFLISTIIFFWFLLVVGTNQQVFQRKYDLRLHLSNAQGLSQGAMVTLSGMEAGRVTEIAFASLDTANVVQVTLAIYREHRHRITTKSEATMRTVGVLGDKYVDISLGAPEDPPLEEGSVLPVRGDIDWTATFEKASLALDDLGRVTQSASTMLAAANDGQGLLATLLHDAETASRMKSTAGDLATVTRKLRSGDGLLGRLLSDPQSSRSLDEFLTRLQSLSAKADSGGGAIARLLADEELGRSLENLIAGSDSLVAAVKDEGTTGRLIRDEHLYEDMSRTLVELRDLLLDIRTNPRKYLKVSVF